LPEQQAQCTRWIMWNLGSGMAGRRGEATSALAPTPQQTRDVLNDMAAWTGCHGIVATSLQSGCPTTKNASTPTFVRCGWRPPARCLNPSKRRHHNALPCNGLCICQRNDFGPGYLQVPRPKVMRWPRRPKTGEFTGENEPSAATTCPAGLQYCSPRNLKTS